MRYIRLGIHIVALRVRKVFQSRLLGTLLDGADGRGHFREVEARLLPLFSFEHRKDQRREAPLELLMVLEKVYIVLVYLLFYLLTLSPCSQCVGFFELAI